MRAHRFLSIIVLVLLGFLVGPRVVRAAVLFPSPKEIAVSPGETFPLSLLLDSEGESINVVQATLTYPKELLEVASVSRGSSFLTLWAEEPSVDRDFGAVRLIGGVPRGSVVFRAAVVSVTFRAKQAGRALVSVDQGQSSVLLNDGAGTATTLTTNFTTVRIGNAPENAPALSSPTHPDESAWYPNRLAFVAWPRLPGAVYSFQLGQDPNAEPDAIPDEVSGETEAIAQYPSLQDGVWYFSLRERLPEQAWGPTARFHLQVDGTPPGPFAPSLVFEEGSRRWLLGFATTDAPSGVDHYELLVLRPRFRSLPFFFAGRWERVTSPVNLGAAPVFQKIVVRAVDLAGNGREATIVGADVARTQRQFAAAATALLFALLTAVFFTRWIWKGQHRQ